MRRELLAVLLAGCVCALHCRQNEIRANTDPPPIEIKATVQPAQTASITAPIDGQVESITAREGTAINAGDPILQLTNPGVERDFAAARTQLEWNAARLKRRAPSAPGRPRDNLEITAKILDLKRNQLEKMKQLRKTNDITSRELEQAEVEYLAALRDYNNERQVITGVPAAGNDNELLRIERQKLVADEKFAASRQAQLRITSPISGVVTRIHVTQGQPVFPRDPIAEVSNTSTLLVRGNVAPELLRYVRPHMRVEVRVFGVPPRTFADEIEYVIPVQGVGSESRSATVVVTIPNPDGSLQPNTEALITVRSLQ